VRATSLTDRIAPVNEMLADLSGPKLGSVDVDLD
jgi:hypothetical protein